MLQSIRISVDYGHCEKSQYSTSVSQMGNPYVFSPRSQSHDAPMDQICYHKTGFTKIAGISRNRRDQIYQCQLPFTPSHMPPLFLQIYCRTQATAD
jgi:hypothetical protein